MGWLGKNHYILQIFVSCVFFTTTKSKEPDPYNILILRVDAGRTNKIKLCLEGSRVTLTQKYMDLVLLLCTCRVVLILHRSISKCISRTMKHGLIKITVCNSLEKIIETSHFTFSDRTEKGSKGKEKGQNYPKCTCIYPAFYTYPKYNDATS